MGHIRETSLRIVSWHHLGVGRAFLDISLSVADRCRLNPRVEPEGMDGVGCRASVCRNLLGLVGREWHSAGSLETCYLLVLM